MKSDRKWGDSEEKVHYHKRRFDDRMGLENCGRPRSLRMPPIAEVVQGSRSYYRKGFRVSLEFDRSEVVVANTADLIFRLPPLPTS